jgi:hypothetical protein
VKAGVLAVAQRIGKTRGFAHALSDGARCLDLGKGVISLRRRAAGGQRADSQNHRLLLHVGKLLRVEKRKSG